MLHNIEATITKWHYIVLYCGFNYEACG